MTTHYVPAYTEVNGRKQRAVCGAWVTAREHSTEPACEPCLDWLTAEKATEHLTADDVFGPPPPPSTTPKRYDFFDPCAGYRPKGSRRDSHTGKDSTP